MRDTEAEVIGNPKLAACRRLHTVSSFLCNSEKQASFCQKVEALDRIMQYSQQNMEYKSFGGHGVPIVGSLILQIYITTYKQQPQLLFNQEQNSTHC